VHSKYRPEALEYRGRGGNSTPLCYFVPPFVSTRLYVQQVVVLMHPQQVGDERRKDLGGLHPLQPFYASS